MITGLHSSHTTEFSFKPLSPSSRLTTAVNAGMRVTSPSCKPQSSNLRHVWHFEVWLFCQVIIHM